MLEHGAGGATCDSELMHTLDGACAYRHTLDIQTSSAENHRDLMKERHSVFGIYRYSKKLFFHMLSDRLIVFRFIKKYLVYTVSSGRHRKHHVSLIDVDIEQESTLMISHLHDR